MMACPLLIVQANEKREVCVGMIFFFFLEENTTFLGTRAASYAGFKLILRRYSISRFLRSGFRDIGEEITMFQNWETSSPTIFVALCLI